MRVFMKNLILTTVVIVLSGCAESVETKIPDNTYKEQFEIADQKIGKMLDALDSSDVPMDQKHEILCTEYPEVYKKQYVPALLKVSPDEYSEQALLKDFENVSDSYKKALAVNCG